MKWFRFNRSRKTGTRSIQLKPFSFVMLIFGLILITAGITFFLTAGDDKVVEVVRPPQQAADREEFNKLYEAYDKLKNNYFQDIDETAVINGAINGMIDALGDPYSDYLNEDEARQLNESISSSFQGIGAEIQSKMAILLLFLQLRTPQRNVQGYYLKIQSLQLMVKVFKVCLHLKLCYLYEVKKGHQLLSPSGEQVLKSQLR